MEEEKQDVNNQEPVQPENVEKEEVVQPETPEQPQETESATPQEAVTQEEEQRVPYERFKTVNDENKWLREQVAQQVQRQQQIQPQQQPTTDPYAGLSAEEKIFYQQRDTRMREIVKEENKELRDQITMGRHEIARMMHGQFRTNHPDIKANSEEERQIAQRISQGQNADDAYKLVMWDKKVGEKTMVNKQQQQERLDAKRQANVVSPNSISPQSIPQGKETFEEELKRKMDTEWDGTI